LLLRSVCICEDFGFQIRLTNVDPDGYWVEVVSLKWSENTENITTTDIETYRMNHTMIRVKDAEKSLAFYQDVMGMKLIRTMEAKAASFNLYFLGYNDPQATTGHMEGLLELTWNYGTEKEDDFKYHNGNDQPQGFGHICVAVDDLQAACDRFEEKEVS
jgi:lactoylglutathione lyase